MQNPGPCPVCSASCRRRFRKSMNRLAVSVPANTENRSAPWALIAEIMNRGEPGAVGAARRGLPERGPGGAGVVVAAPAGLVDEPDGAADRLGRGGDRRIFG